MESAVVRYEVGTPKFKPPNWTKKKT